MYSGKYKLIPQCYAPARKAKVLKSDSFKCWKGRQSVKTLHARRLGMEIAAAILAMPHKVEIVHILYPTISPETYS